MRSLFILLAMSVVGSAVPAMAMTTAIASWVAITVCVATAASRPISSALHRHPAATPGAPKIPVSTRRRRCLPTVSANPEGGSDAHFSVGHFGNGFRRRPGGGPNIRGRTGLSARASAVRVLRGGLHAAARAVQLGTRGRRWSRAGAPANRPASCRSRWPTATGRRRHEFRCAGRRSSSRSSARCTPVSGRPPPARRRGRTAFW